MKTIHAKAVRLVRAYRKGKRTVPDGAKDLKRLVWEAFADLLGDGEDDGSDTVLLGELLCDPEWVAEAGECELVTGIPFFAKVAEMYRSGGGRAPHLEMRIVQVHDRQLAVMYKVIKDGFEVTAAGMPKLRVRHHVRDNGDTYSGLGAAHGVVYATIEYKKPADAFSRIVYLCWSGQRVL